MLGAIAGISSIALAIPILAQVSSAASSTQSATASAQTSAQVTQQAAEQAALAIQPGQISEATKLKDWDGTSSYKVEIKSADGNDEDVIVDAQTGKVTDHGQDGQRGPHHGPGHDANDQPDQPDQPGQPDQPDSSI